MRLKIINDYRKSTEARQLQELITRKTNLTKPNSL